MTKIKVICRHGVEYSLLARGAQGEVRRLKEMLSNCCCYVCHNRGCETPIEGKQECRNECELYGKRFCENSAASEVPDDAECCTCVYFYEDDGGEICMLSGEATTCCSKACADYSEE